MNDQDLLIFLQNTAPEDLTAEQIDFVRARLAESPELRQELAGRLRLEQGLAAILGRIDISPDLVAAKADKLEPKNSKTRWLGIVAGLVLLAFVSWLGLNFANRTNPNPVIADGSEAIKSSTFEGTENDPQNTVEKALENNPTPNGNKTPVVPGSTNLNDPAVKPANPAESAKSTEKELNAKKTPPVVVPPPRREEPAPWQAALDNPNPPRFSEISFDTFDITKSLPNRELLLRWFEPITVPGATTKINEEKRRLAANAGFEGTIKLRAPLPEKTALRLSLENFKILKIHLFTGTEGVTLAYYEDESFRWNGYSTTRKPNAPHPETFHLTATDDGRCSRTEFRFGGPFEIRYQDREVLLTRGDIVLLRAPLSAAPEQVFFEGKASFYGIALLKTQDVPFPKNKPLPVVAQINKPAEQKWTEKLGEGGKLERLPNGSVQFSSSKERTRGWASFPLPKIGLHEIVMRLENIEAGTGVFLGSENQGPTHTVKFDRIENPKLLQISARAEDSRAAEQHTLNWLKYHSYSIVGSSCWLKFIVGCGSARWWVSSDGEHWAEGGAPLQLATTPTHLGLQYAGDKPSNYVTLRSVAFHELDGLTKIVKPELLAKAANISKTANPEEWNTAVKSQQPKDVDPVAWRQACLIRALSEGRLPKACTPVVFSMLDDIVAGTLPLESKIRALDQGLSLLHVNESRDVGISLAKRYFDTGWNEFERTEARPFSSIRRALMSVSLGQGHPIPLGNSRSVRGECLQLLYAGRWQETLNFCRQLRYFHQHELTKQQNEGTKFVEWTETLARREAPIHEKGEVEAPINPKLPPRRGQGGRGNTLAKQRANWSSPLMEELSKETYNTLAELQAVIDGNAYQDAAQMIASIDPASSQGVAPTVTDDRLLVSLSAAIRLAIDTYPKLQSVLDEKFGSLAQLRVRQAIAAGNVATVELATVQFPTSEASAEAHRWIGDRALSTGRFTQALSEYRKASLTAGSSFKEELQLRERLAAAMLGQDVGAPATRNVQLGERLFTASEFEKTLGDLRSKGATAQASIAVNQVANVDGSPRPSGFEIHNRSRLDGPCGEDAQAEVTREINRLQIDWAGRQIAATKEDNTLFVSNRFQIAAYDLNQEGKRLWQSQGLPEKSLKARDWTLVPMRPVVLPRQIVARQLVGIGATLVSVNKNDGKLFWSIGPPKDSMFASDPIWGHDRLLVLLMTNRDQQGSILRLASVDAETGDILTQVDLARLSEVWHERRFCEVTFADDSLVIALGGAVVCCDQSGNVRWIRKQVTLPPVEEPDWVQQYYDRPLLVNGKLLIAQPGVRVIECVDPLTGRLYWQTLVPNIHRILGVIEDRLIAKTDEGFAAFDLGTGKRLWQQNVSGITTAQLCGGKGHLAYIEAPTDSKSQKQIPRMVWLDSKTGRAVAATTLAKLEKQDLRLGPIFANQDRLWLFAGQGQHDPQRDLVELVPNGNADRLP